jgi:hypothetical protein
VARRVAAHEDGAWVREAAAAYAAKQALTSARPSAIGHSSADVTGVVGA